MARLGEDRAALGSVGLSTSLNEHFKYVSSCSICCLGAFIREALQWLKEAAGVRLISVVWLFSRWLNSVGLITGTSSPTEHQS